MVEKYLLCRDIGEDRYFLCWDKLKCEAIWISSERLPYVTERFGQVVYESRVIAEDRARMFCKGPLSDRCKCYVTAVNL